MSLENLNLETLKRVCKEYEVIEGRGGFYDLAMELLDVYSLHSAIILLATWNTGRFRFFMSDQKNLKDLKKVLEKNKPLFEKLKDKDFRTVNFDEICNDVEEIYSSLSKVRGVEFTGASKVMHLFNRNLFVMWDTKIRKEYMKKKYEEEYKINIEGTSSRDFLNFQKLMQAIFGRIEWDNQNKTLPKAIDEYNYITITYHKKMQKKPYIS